MAQTSTPHRAAVDTRMPLTSSTSASGILPRWCDHPRLTSPRHPVGARGVDLVEVDPPDRCSVLDGRRRVRGDGRRVGSSEHRPDQHPMPVRGGERSPQLTGDVGAVSHAVQLPGPHHAPGSGGRRARRDQLATQHDDVREIDRRIRRHGVDLAPPSAPRKPASASPVDEPPGGTRRDVRPTPGTWWAIHARLAEEASSSKCRFPRSGGETDTPQARYRSTYSSERRPRSRCQAR